MVQETAFREDAPAHQLNLLDAILQATELGMLVTDLDHRIVACNARFGEIFCVDMRESIRLAPHELRRRVLPLIVRSDDWLKNLDEVYEKPDLKYSDQIQLRSAEHREVQRYTGPVHDSCGSICARLWTFRDVNGSAAPAMPTDLQLIQIGSLCIDLQRRTVKVGERSIDLTNTEFKLLTYLAEHQGEALPRDRIFNHIWGYDIDCNTNSLDVFVYRLRRKIERADGHPVFLQTIKGYGVKLIAAG